MENAPLNEAHYQGRRADAHLKFRRFDEAAECHRRAADLLTSALQFTNQPRALESIQLQKVFHLRQVELMQLKKSQYEKYCKIINSEMSKMALANDGSGADDSNLHLAIFKTMEEADSLMERLLQNEELPFPIKVQEDQVDLPVEPALVIGSKQPKDEKQVVEELKTLTQHLHDLVKQLVTQLDASHKENECLRAQVRMLTSQLETGHIPEASTVRPSPEVTPPDSQQDSFLATRTLPILAPLEMPQFDYSMFEKNLSKTPDAKDE